MKSTKQNGGTSFIVPPFSVYLSLFSSVFVGEGAGQALIFPVDPFVVLFFRDHLIADRAGFADGVGVNFEKRGIDHVAGIVAHDPVPGSEAAVHDVAAVYFVQFFLRQVHIFHFHSSHFLYPPLILFF